MIQVRKLLFNLLLMMLGTGLFAQTPDYYFPDEILDSTDASIPMPEDVIGFPIGKWHITHDQIIRYAEVLAETSPRVDWYEYARSHEDRPLFVLRITSSENHERLESIRANHLASAKGEDIPHPDIPDPVVLYQGNSIHGDESSGANAAMLYAWYLATSNEQRIQTVLEESVILLDPCFNPDGLHRFSTWVNSNTGTEVRTGDPADREFNEPWPSGRTNHYWFDLNRDWLLVQHPESQGRIRLFNQWLPHILTDHHEMGSNATYFFQPGIQSRTNPITLERNQELTTKIATYHSEYLDEIGSLYYTEERFDDYYYGKGSTYPDVRGSIGILFEQASSRGHRQQTENGLLTFPFTIKNQLMTLRSTLEAGIEMSDQLKEYQRQFHKIEQKQSERHEVRAYLVEQCRDPVRWNSFLDLLENHDIQANSLSRDLQVDGIQYRKDRDVVIPMNEDDFFLKRTLFETIEEFPDSLFYDVSTWTLPLAFHLQYSPWTGQNAGKISGEMIRSGSAEQPKPFRKSTYGYILPWYHFNTASAAGSLLRQDFRLSVATKPFEARSTDGVRQFRRGDLFIPVQRNRADQLHASIEALQKRYNLPVYSVTSGLTPKGIDLGSPSLESLHYPNTLLIAGDGIRAYDAGEIWHLFNTRIHMPVTRIAPDRLQDVDLDKYRRIVISHAYHININDNILERLKKWVREGGVLILERGACRWAASRQLISLSNTERKADPVEETDQKAEFKEYSGLSRDRGSQRIGGAIFRARMDTTHPLTYGFERNDIALFRRGTRSIGYSENPYAQPIIYTEHPLVSGYAPEESVEKLAGSAAVRVFRNGRGRIICFADNTHFRAYFRGTERLFVNAVFFGHIIDGRSAESVSGK